MTEQQISLAIWHATYEGYFHYLKDELSTDDNILMVGRFCHGEAIIHGLARHRQLQYLPRRLLTEENLIIRDFSNETVLDVACYYANYPDQLLGIPLSESCRAIVGNEWWLKNQKYIQDTDHAGVVPTIYRRPCSISVPDALKEAIRLNCLPCLKDELLTEEAFNTFEADDYTALMTAAFRGYLEQVPAPILSEANLLLSIKTGSSALRLAAFSGHLDQLLGVELSEKSKPIVGDAWWDKNQKYIAEITNAKAELKKPKADDNDIELF